MVAVVDPQFTRMPSIDATQRLRVTGYFPSPAAIDFDLIFEEVGGRWRLFGISVSPGSAGAAATKLPQYAPGWDLAFASSYGERASR